LIGPAAGATLSGVVSRRTLRIVFVVVAIVVLLWIVGYVLFNNGDSAPGSGTGDTVTEPTP